MESSDSKQKKPETPHPTEESDFSRLPEKYVAHILSLTSPQDVCTVAAVSSTLRSTATSDAVWKRLLLPDHRGILSRAVDHVTFASKKELFSRLYRPLLIDGGRKSFVLDKSSGKKCFMLSARELGIIWGGAPQYWEWTSHPESRFSEVAVLLSVCWLEITGTLNAAELSPKTTYVAYLVFKLSNESYGFDNKSQEARVTVGTETSMNNVSLQTPQPEIRDDGWMEVAMGEFFNEDGCEVVIKLLEVDDWNWKRGLIVEGIEFRLKTF